MKKFFTAFILICFSTQSFAQNALPQQIDNETIKQNLRKSFVFNKFVGPVVEHLKEANIVYTSTVDLEDLYDKLHKRERNRKIMIISELSAAGGGIGYDLSHRYRDYSKDPLGTSPGSLVFGGAALAWMATEWYMGKRIRNVNNEIRKCKVENCFARQVDGAQNKKTRFISLEKYTDDQIKNFVTDAIAERVKDLINDDGDLYDIISRNLEKLCSPDLDVSGLARLIINYRIDSLVSEQFGLLMSIENPGEDASSIHDRVKEFKDVVEKAFKKNSKAEDAAYSDAKKERKIEKRREQTGK